MKVWQGRMLTAYISYFLSLTVLTFLFSMSDLAWAVGFVWFLSWWGFVPVAFITDPYNEEKREEKP